MLDIILALVFGHWIIAGWLVIVAALALTQTEEAIRFGAYNDPNDIYGKSVNIIVGVGFLWVVITIISFVKWVWGVA